MTFSSFLRASKDIALAGAARALFNSRYRKVGTMTELSIDTRNRTVRAQIELKGEAEPVAVTIGKYSLQRQGDGMLLTIDAATASREWIAALLEEFVVGRSFPVPDKIGALLRVLA